MRINILVSNISWAVFRMPKSVDTCGYHCFVDYCGEATVCGSGAVQYFSVGVILCDQFLCLNMKLYKDICLFIFNDN